MRVWSARASAGRSITRARPARRTERRRLAAPSVTFTRAVRPARAGGEARTTRRPRTRTVTSARPVRAAAGGAGGRVAHGALPAVRNDQVRRRRTPPAPATVALARYTDPAISGSTG